MKKRFDVARKIIEGYGSRQKLPVFIEAVVVFGIILSIYSMIDPGFYKTPVYWVLWTFYVPITPSLFSLILLITYAAMLQSRKRLAVYIGVVVAIFQSMLMVLSVLILTTVSVLSDDHYWSLICLYSLHCIVGLVVAFLLTRSIDVFSGKIIKGKAIRASIFFVVGIVTIFTLGFVLISIFHDTLDSFWDKFRWILRAIIGSEFRTLVGKIDGTAPEWIAVLLEYTSSLVLIISLFIFISGSKMFGLQRKDTLTLRRLLLKYPEHDSLAYFATRNDRRTVFSANGKACVSYRVITGVAVAAGDPIGDPQYWENAIEEWIKLCYRYGWVPSVEAVSEKAAVVYKACGMKVKEMGDEAIVDVSSFNISSPALKPIAQAYRRVLSDGVTITCKRLRDIGDEEVKVLEKCANSFRSGSERGYSMALDRSFSKVDDSSMVVVARGEDGQVQALLTFVPWGSKGLSLNLMRRSRDSVNGIVEAMIVTLLNECKQSNIEKVSLNFAVMRKIFVSGERVDATYFERFVKFVFQCLSKFWQIESLYRSNDRYRPIWYKRYLCYPSVLQLPHILFAVGLLEGFIPVVFNKDKQYIYADDQELIAQIRQINEEILNDVFESRNIPEQTRVRIEKMDKLTSNGVDCYPVGVKLGLPIGQFKAEYEKLVAESENAVLNSSGAQPVLVSGRLKAIRKHGKVIFADIVRDAQSVQVILDKSMFDSYFKEHDTSGDSSSGKRNGWELFKYVDLGDYVSFAGYAGKSNTQQFSLYALYWVMNAKSLRPMPRNISTLDSRTKMRDRTLYLLNDNDARATVRAKFMATSAVRQTLNSMGYLEVETPVLHSVQGGANARPFVTYMNAYDSEVFLRIAPELYLKKLAVSGFEAIYEIGRSFRNEGADATHNPEFTSLEAYKAGADYEDMRQLCEQIIKNAAVAVWGECVAYQPKTLECVKDYPTAKVIDGVEYAKVDLDFPWKVVKVYDAISEAVGQKVDSSTDLETLIEICNRFDIETPAVCDQSSLIDTLYDELVESNTVLPTFYIDFPKDSSPLTRVNRHDPKLAERWDLVAFGMELGTAYSELTDPVDQRERFVKQSFRAAAGDVEAMSVDEDFLNSLELGLVSTGGLGIGIERMVMMITGVNIRQVLPFPFVKPKS